MARSTDALVGVALVVVGLFVFVAWRSGSLKRLVTPTAEKYSDIAGRGAAPRATAVDIIPNAGGAPHLTTSSHGAGAPGVPTNGFTATGPVAGSTPLYFPRITQLPPTSTNGERLSDRMTGLVTQIPDAAVQRVRDDPWHKDRTDLTTTADIAIGGSGSGGRIEDLN